MYAIRKVKYNKKRKRLPFLHVYNLLKDNTTSFFYFPFSLLVQNLPNQVKANQSQRNTIYSSITDNGNNVISEEVAVAVVEEVAGVVEDFLIHNQMNGNQLDLVNKKPYIH